MSAALFLCNCTEVEKYKETEARELPKGKYYAKYWRNVDTIVFKPYNSEIKIGGFTELFWTITEDSIIQRDTRGLEFFFRKEKCTYHIESDTLSLLFRKTDQSNKKHTKGGDIKEKYKIELLNDTIIKLVKPPYNSHISQKTGRGSIDDHIQLR